MLPVTARINMYHYVSCGDLLYQLASISMTVHQSAG